MHILTKILIAFGAMLSVALAGLTIAYSANAGVLRRGLESATAEVEALKAQVSLQASRIGMTAGEQSRLAEQLVAERDSLVAQIGTLQTERAKLQDEIRTGQLASATATGQIASLQAANEAALKLQASLNAERQELAKKLADANTREARDVARISELDRANTVLEQETRAMREQLAELRNTLEQSRGAGQASAGVSGPSRPFTAGQFFSTRIKQVLTDPTGELAVIDLGSAGGVRENMLLVIVRNGQFLANLRVIKADVNESVGRVDKLGKTVTIQADDQVVSKLN